MSDDPEYNRLAKRFVSMLLIKDSLQRHKALVELSKDIHHFSQTKNIDSGRVFWNMCSNYKDGQLFTVLARIPSIVSTLLKLCDNLKIDCCATTHDFMISQDLMSSQDILMTQDFLISQDIMISQYFMISE